ncbi:hypothetical protein PSTT_10866 [Puccinia striiformis]|uniref:Uncharacterized protein n=1 Tax=Puccinia striiformis TaxID=27350 RepID=A0A2S4V2P0_9BASI|nr:hypothetical protein PSTT_10866 [Puccinia striiformis]
MTKIVYHQFDLNNMSIVYQPPPRFSGTSAATGTTFSSFSRPHNDSVGRPPLLSIPQIQPTTISTASSSQSPTSSVSEYSPKLNKPLTPTREKRRKLRSTRAVSPVPLHSLPILLVFSPTAITHHVNLEPSIKVNHSATIQTISRCYLSDVSTLSHPSLLSHPLSSKYHDCTITVLLCQYSNCRTLVHNTSRYSKGYLHMHTDTLKSILSIDLDTTPTYFTKTVPRSHRTQRSSLSSTLDYPTSFLEINKSEEQDKWWHWAKICKVTGDGNKSSYLTPLPCQDLKRNFDDYNNDTNQQDTDFRIQTRPLSESAIEQQKFYYSGS